MTNSSTGSYVVYASLLVSALAHFGWVLSQNDALAIVAGVVVLFSTIYQHFVTKSIVAKAKLAGVQGIK